MAGKAQSAMEFLLTYGWAILVVIVAISALAYFGVLNPSDWFFPETCSLPTGLSCLDHSITYVYNAGAPEFSTNTLEMRIKNNLGFKIDIENILISEFGKSDNVNIELENSQVTKPPNNLELLDMTDVWNFGNPNRKPALKSGEKYELEFTLEVVNLGSGLTHQYKGTIKGKIN